MDHGNIRRNPDKTAAKRQLCLPSSIDAKKSVKKLSVNRHKITSGNGENCQLSKYLAAPVFLSIGDIGKMQSSSRQPSQEELSDTVVSFLLSLEEIIQLSQKLSQLPFRNVHDSLALLPGER